MDLQQRAAIEAACRHLTSAYCHFIDRGEARRVVELFTEDAEWAAPEGSSKDTQHCLTTLAPEKINAAANRNTSAPIFGWRTSARPRQVAASISPCTGMTGTLTGRARE